MPIEATDSASLLQKVNNFRTQALQRGIKQKDIDVFLTQQLSQIVGQGGVPVDKIQTGDFNKLLLQAQQVVGGTYKPEEAAGDQTNAAIEDEQSMQSGIRAYEQVRDIYQNDPGVIIKQLEPGKFASRSYDSALFIAVENLLRMRTGAAAPETEVRRYMAGYTPKVGDKPEDVANKLNSLKFDLMAEGGKAEEYKPDTIKPTGKGYLRQIPERLLGNAMNVAQDVGVGLAQKQSGVQESRDQSIQMAQQLEQKAQSVTDPAQKDKLMKLAQDIYLKSSAGAGQQAAPYSPDVQENPLARGAKAGFEIASTAALASSLLNAPKAIKSFKPSSLNVRNTLGEARRQAAKEYTEVGSKINTKKLIDAGKKAVENAPEGKEILRKNLPAIKSATNPNTLLDRLGYWKKAYTQSGKIGSTAASQVYDALYKEASRQLKEVAPEVAKKTAQLKLTYQIPKAIKQTAFYGGLAGGGVAGLAAIKALLQGRLTGGGGGGE